MRVSGFYSDVGYRRLGPTQAAGARAIHDAIGKADPESRRLIASYLAGGTAISRVPARGHDVFDEARRVSLDIVTDGEWVWPLDAAHYCERYGVLPEPGLARRALESDGICPAVDHETARRVAHEFFEVGDV